MMALLIVFLMVSSILGFVVGNHQGSNLRFGDHKFEFVNGVYTTEINDATVAFLYAPDTLTDIEIPEEFTEELKNSFTVYATVDENHTFRDSVIQSVLQMSGNLFETNRIYVQPGLTTENIEIPEITCENTDELVIYFTQEEDFSYEDKCLKIPIITNFDAARYTESINYAVYGVK